nr:MAG TPA_asm: hypothetical protein [Caudoviricetes sp.]
MNVCPLFAHSGHGRAHMSIAGCDGLYSSQES